MIDNFKQNIQERLILEIEKRGPLGAENPSANFREGFMACFEILEPDIRKLLIGLDEIVNGTIFYSEIPTFAKEVLNRWHWGKSKHFEKSGLRADTNTATDEKK